MPGGSETIFKGATLVEMATGLSLPPLPANEREGQSGRGRWPLTKRDPGLLAALEALIDPIPDSTESPLRWTTKTCRALADELTRQAHPASHSAVARLLRRANYKLQANRETRSESSCSDRSEQFKYIDDNVRQFLHRGQPVISLETKKRKLVVDIRIGGRQWRPAGRLDESRVHDFLSETLGNIVTQGVYDILNGQGWVNTGIDHYISRFAVSSIRRWWDAMGQRRFPQASELLITANGGGSKATRLRLWKVSLQALADALGLKLVVCHFPTGMSKWKKIEHRQFNVITQKGRGRPLVNHQTIVSLIASATTSAGMVINATLDTDSCDPPAKISDQELELLHLTPHDFHGDWNYTIWPG